MNQCDSVQGCAIDRVEATSSIGRPKPVREVIFVTDPICSHCWAIEPAWRKLNLNYRFSSRYIHGGLLPGWQSFSDSGNGISKPEHVIPHWDHVALTSRQPIDSSVWAKDPISNSYILCRAAIAVRLIAPEQESAFVRKMREQVFLYAVNITREEVLCRCAEAVGVAREQFLQCLVSTKVAQIFDNEIDEMARLKARGFPSLFFSDNKAACVTGSGHYRQLESALLKYWSGPIEKRNLSDAQKVKAYPSWTMRELTEVLECNDEKARSLALLLGYRCSAVAGGQLWFKAT